MSETAIHEDVVEGEEIVEESIEESTEELQEEAQPLSQRDEVINRIAEQRRKEMQPDEPEEEEPEEETLEAETLEEVADIPDVPEVPEEEPKTVVVKVDGVEQEVSLDEVIEHGKKTLQKQSAADLRLEQAALRTKELDRREAQFNELLERQKAKPDETIENTKKEFATALVEDEGKAAQMFAELLQRQAEHEDRIKELAYGVSQNSSFMQEQQENEAQRLQSLFKREFPELASDPHLKAKANEFTGVIMHHNPDMTHEDVIIQAGKATREYYADKFGFSEKPEEEEAVTPRQVKKQMPKPVQKATVRQPAKKEPKPMTTSEIIAAKIAERNPF